MPRACSCCGRRERRFWPLVQFGDKLLCRMDDFCSLPWRRATGGEV